MVNVASRPVNTREETRYALRNRLGGPLGRSGRVWKILSLPGFYPRTIQPIASCYTDNNVPDHTNTETKFQSRIILEQKKNNNNNNTSVSCYTKFIILSIDGRFVLLRRSPRLRRSLTSASIFLQLCCVAVTVLLCTSKVCGSISDVTWPDGITDL